MDWSSLVQWYRVQEKIHNQLIVCMIAAPVYSVCSTMLACMGCLYSLLFQFDISLLKIYLNFLCVCCCSIHPLSKGVAPLWNGLVSSVLSAVSWKYQIIYHFYESSTWTLEPPKHNIFSGVCTLSKSNFVFSYFPSVYILLA